MLAATQAEIPMALYAPATIKSHILGKYRSKSDKEGVAEAVRLMTGFTTQDLNQSDAIAVAITHLYTKGVDNRHEIK